MANLENSKKPETVGKPDRSLSTNSGARESGSKHQHCSPGSLNELCLPETAKPQSKHVQVNELKPADLTSDAALASRAAHPVARITSTVAHTARAIGRAGATLSLLSGTFTQAGIDKKNKLLAKFTKVAKWLGPAGIIAGAVAESVLDPSIRGLTKTAATLGVGFGSLKLGTLALAAMESSLLIPGAAVLPAVGTLLLSAVAIGAIGFGAWSLTTKAIDKAFDSKLFKK